MNYPPPRKKSLQERQLLKDQHKYVKVLKENSKQQMKG